MLSSFLKLVFEFPPRTLVERSPCGTYVCSGPHANHIHDIRATCEYVCHMALCILCMVPHAVRGLFLQSVQKLAGWPGISR